MSEQGKSVFHGIGLALMFVGVFGQFIEFSVIRLFVLVALGWVVASIPKVIKKDKDE